MSVGCFRIITCDRCGCETRINDTDYGKMNTRLPKEWGTVQDEADHAADLCPNCYMQYTSTLKAFLSFVAGKKADYQKKMELIDKAELLKQIDIDSDGKPGWYGDTWQFIETIKNMPAISAVSEWIPCSERLPEEQGQYKEQTMNSKEYTLPNGKKAVFEYDVCGIGKVTLECMDELMAMIADRPQGEWKHLKGDEWLCSNCGYVVWTEGSWEHPLERGKDYCEHCGAQMKGADDE